MYTIGRCVVLTCSDYFKSTGVLTLLAAVPKGVKKRQRKRKHILCRQREFFKRKIKKKSLILKRVDIKDSFRNMFSDNDGGDDRRVNAKGMRFVVDRSKVFNNGSANGKPTAVASDRHRHSSKGLIGNENNCDHPQHTFSIINVNDIIRDTNALLKF